MYFMTRQSYEFPGKSENRMKLTEIIRKDENEIVRCNRIVTE